MAILEVEHICKSFEDTEVLKDISFSLEKSQALSIIGSSGSGKTTLLRCLNFLERPDKGIIRVGGETKKSGASIPVTHPALRRPSHCPTCLNEQRRDSPRRYV